MLHAPLALDRADLTALTARHALDTMRPKVAASVMTAILAAAAPASAKTAAVATTKSTSPVAGSQAAVHRARAWESWRAIGEPRWTVAPMVGAFGGMV
jgi:hypothetical protein